MASSSSGAPSWRTAFLTLRDETLTSPPPPALLGLLRDLALALAHSPDALASAAAAAATDLPPHEVTSDVMLLAELASAVAECPEAADTLLRICQLIHGVSCRVCLEIDSSSWAIMLNFLEKIVSCLLGNASIKNTCLSSTSRMQVMANALEILRFVVKTCGRSSSSSESSDVVRLLLYIVSCLHAELLNLYHSSGMIHPDANSEIRNPKYNNLWDMEAIAFSMMKDALSRIGPSISANLWQSVVEVLRKDIDFLASKNLLIENNVMSRFYTSLLNCLHLVLSDPKGSLPGDVAGFVATLQLFFMYGLANRSLLTVTTAGSKDKGFSSSDVKCGQMEDRESKHGRYRPPHLRKREGANYNLSDAQSPSDCEPSKYGITSADSDGSDSDGTAKDGDRFRSSKARLAAVVCIQDLCRADPKSLTSLWTLLLPENDVLQPRKYQATLMTSLIFDPVIKIRIESASTLVAMLEGHSLVLLQVAEYKESGRRGSYTTLSSSLGQKLMQLHKGILYLIQHEAHSGFLASLFKVLVHLISATPYARMPGELLPTVVASLHARIVESLALKNEHIGLLLSALSCLGAAFSTSPPSFHVLKMLEDDISRGSQGIQQESSLLFLLIQSSERGRHPSIRFEALQALRAVSHNYPNLVNRFWEQISATVHDLLQIQTLDDSTSEVLPAPFRGEIAKMSGSTSERCTMAAVKVLDECLRAVSGFKGADDLVESRLLDIQHVSDSTRTKKISSAPSFELDGPEIAKYYTAGCPSGSEQWSEVIAEHLPQCLLHTSPMVRAASVTCFAGMTSTVFFSLTEDKQDFVISSAVAAALNDGSPFVRSAACRAIGVITCFSKICSCSRLLGELIRAAEINTHDPLASVRITASWALANICDSLRHKVTGLHSKGIADAGVVNDSESISLLVESALRLTKDGDKIKSNAVRALGNLSRFIKFAHHVSTNDRPSVLAPTSGEQTEWLARMVQAFVSCVTTGNVKVQWNVCHALSNLFMNDTLKLHDMPWAPAVFSVLLLLLRDSTNFKIRIHAAVALAVPASRHDYGSSFSDIVQGLEHVLESLGSEHASTPSSFKYKDNLGKQLAATTLHVLGFVSPEDDRALKDFLIKKAFFLEDWFKMLCSSLRDVNDNPSVANTMSSESQEDGCTLYVPNKAMLSKALESLFNVYECSSHNTLAQRFERLADSLS